MYYLHIWLYNSKGRMEYEYCPHHTAFITLLTLLAGMVLNKKFRSRVKKAHNINLRLRTETDITEAPRMSNIFLQRCEEYGISLREREVLAYKNTGLSNKEVAEKCHIAATTADSHFAHIYEKLQVNNITEAFHKLHH